MSDNNLFLGVTDFFYLLVMSVFIGTSLFTKEMYDDIVGNHYPCRKDGMETYVKCKYLIALRFASRITGSTMGSWLAAAFWLSANLPPQAEWVVIGVGGVAGWKFLDAFQSAFVSLIIRRIGGKNGQ